MKKLIDTTSVEWEQYEALTVVLGLEPEQGMPHYIIIETIEEL